MTALPNPVPYARFRLAKIALQLFQGGKDTYDISKCLGISESDCVELLRLARGKVPEG